MITKNIFNRYLAVALTFVFTSLVAKAATPFAIWDKDFTNLTSGGFTIDAKGNTVNDDSIVISQNVGVAIGNTNSKLNNSTFIIHSENLDLANSNNQYLLSLRQNILGGGNGDASYNKVGLALGPNGAPIGIWNNGAYTSGNVASLSTGRILIVNIQTSGGVFAWEVVTENRVRTLRQVYSSTGLKASNTNYSGFTLGGVLEKSSTNLKPATGWKITRLAVFDSTLSQTDMLGFVFDSEFEEIPITGPNVNLSSIVERVQESSSPVVQVTLDDGAVINVDTTENITGFTIASEGSITLNAESKPEGLENLDLSGVKGAVNRPWLTPGVIGFNFNANAGRSGAGTVDQAADTSLALESGDWFKDASSASGSATLFDGLSTLTWTSANVYSQVATASCSNFMHGYLDDGATVNITLSNIPYESYDLIIYCATDSSGLGFKAKTVNGKIYTYDETQGKTVETTDATAKWGNSTAGAGKAVIGVSAIKITDLSGKLTINGGTNDNGARGCIAAIQIMPAGYSSSKTLTLTADANWTDAANWTGGIATSGNVDINVTGDVTLTVNYNGLNLNNINVTGEGSLTILVAGSRTLTATSLSAASGTPITIGQGVNIANISGNITYLYKTDTLVSTMLGATYTKGVGSADNLVNLGANGGSITLKGGEGVDPYYLNQTHTGVSTTANFIDAQLYAPNSQPEAHGFGVGAGTYTFSGSTSLTAAKFVLSQGGAGRTAVFTMGDTSSVTVEGTSNANNNTASIMFGHWDGPSTFTIKDEATFTAAGTDVLIGLTRNNHTINLNGGEFTVKGIKTSTNASGTNILNLNGGKLTLGSTGIDTYGSGRTLAINLSKPTTIKTAADVVPITQAITATGEGVINKEGEGVLKLANALRGKIGTISAGKIVFVATESEIADGEISIPVTESTYSLDQVSVENANGENIAIINHSINDGILKLEFQTNTIKSDSRISSDAVWSTLTGEVLVKGTTESPVTLTIDAAIPAAVTSIKALGNVKIVFDEGAEASDKQIIVDSGNTLTVSGNLKNPIVPHSGSTLIVEGTTTANKRILTEAGTIVKVMPGAVLKAGVDSMFNSNLTLHNYGTIDLDTHSLNFNNHTTECEYNLYAGSTFKSSTGTLSYSGGYDFGINVKDYDAATNKQVVFEVASFGHGAYDNQETFNIEEGVALKYSVATSNNADVKFAGTNIGTLEISSSRSVVIAEDLTFLPSAALRLHAGSTVTGKYAYTAFGSGVAIIGSTVTGEGTVGITNNGDLESLSIGANVQFRVNGEHLVGTLTLNRNTIIVFPQGHEQNAALTLAQTALIYDDQSTGTPTYDNQVFYIGDTLRKGTVAYNLAAKTVSYGYILLSTYDFSSEESAIESATQNGGVYSIPASEGKYFAQDAAFTGVGDGYQAYVVNEIASVAKKTDSLSIKFAPASDTEGTISKTDGNVGGFPVAGVFWNHSKQYTGTGDGTSEILKVKDGNGIELADTLVYYYMPNMYDVNGRNVNGRNKQTTGNGKLTYSYFDDSTRIASPVFPYEITQEGFDSCSLVSTPSGKLNWEVAIKNPPYEKFYLYVYQASDQTSSTISLLPIAVKANDGEWKYFAGNNEGATIPGDINSSWNGAPYCDQDSMQEGTHYIKYLISRATLGLAPGEEIDTLYISHPNRGNGDNRRLGLAGIQLVKVESDGVYVRRSDAELAADGITEKTWTADNSWLDSDGEITSWKAEGDHYVRINADDVSEIFVDDVITANEVTLINTAAEEGEVTKSFKFLTKEDLADVATPNDNPTYILKSPVNAVDFKGELYLQSRIGGEVAVGTNARVVFVAYDNDETTAYPYNFTTLANPIKKVGTGTFIVPKEMFGYKFEVAEGYLEYSNSDTAQSKTVTGLISGVGTVVKAGEGTVVFSAANVYTNLVVRKGLAKAGVQTGFGANNYDSETLPLSVITIEDGATVDLAGTGDSTYDIRFEGNGYNGNGALVNNGGNIGTATRQNKIFTLTGNASVGGSGNFGLLANGYGETELNLGEFTLTKKGANTFFLCNTTINGIGKIRLESGVFMTHKTASVGNEATLELAGNCTLTLNSELTINTFALSGVTRTSNDIEELTNLHFTNLELNNGATLDMTSGIKRFYTLKANSSGKIKITKPSIRTRIAAVTDDATGVTLIDENGATLPSCVMNGYLYYGAKYEEASVSANDIDDSVVYPEGVEVIDYDVDTQYIARDEFGGLVVATKTDSISINFGAESEVNGSVSITDTVVGAFPVSGASWNNTITSLKNGAGEPTSMSIEITGSYSIGTVDSNDQVNGNQKITKNYIQDIFAVTLENLPYEKFDLYLISANNASVNAEGNIVYSPIALTANESVTKYFGSSVAGSVESIWQGKPFAEEGMVNGQNYLKVRITKATFGLGAEEPLTKLTIAPPMFDNGGVIGLAGIQLVKVESDGVYVRRSDAELDEAGIDKTWTAENSWKDSDGIVTSWKAEGDHHVTINADNVATITINDIIAADSVTVINTAAQEGEEAKTFKFLTTEELDHVATEDNTAPRLDSIVSLGGFSGIVYFQSRITGIVSLGTKTRINFVADVADKETTAYPYKFDGSILPIRKTGPGTFIVPESMYETAPFEITEGAIKYDYSGTTAKSVTKTLSGPGKLVKAGTGSLTFTVANSFTGGTIINGGTLVMGHTQALGSQGANVTLNSGAILDVYGRQNQGLNLIMNGGKLINTYGNVSNGNVQFRSISLTEDSEIDIAYSTGIINNGYAATTLDLGGHKLAKKGNGIFYLIHVTATSGVIDLAGGSISSVGSASDLSAADLVVSGNAELGGAYDITFKTIEIKEGAQLSNPADWAKTLKVTDKLTGATSINNFVFGDGATLETSTSIAVTGSLSFAGGIKIKGLGYSDTVFTGAPELGETKMPVTVIKANDSEEDGFILQRKTDGSVIIAVDPEADKSVVISGTKKVSELEFVTNQIKLEGDAELIIDTDEIPERLEFKSNAPANLTISYKTIYQGEIVVVDENVTIINEKYYPEVAIWPQTIAAGKTITFIGSDDPDAPNENTNAFQINNGGTLNIEGNLKLNFGDRKIQGVLNILEGATLTALSNDAVNYGNNTGAGANGTVNVYGVLDMANKRWTYHPGNTLNLYVGGEIKGTGDGNGAMDYHLAGTINVLEVEGKENNTAKISANIKCQQPVTFNIAENAKLEFTGDVIGSAAFIMNGGTLSISSIDKIKNGVSGTGVVEFTESVDYNLGYNRSALTYKFVEGSTVRVNESAIDDGSYTLKLVEGSSIPSIIFTDAEGNETTKDTDSFTFDPAIGKTAALRDYSFNDGNMNSVGRESTALSADGDTIRYTDEGELILAGHPYGGLKAMTEWSVAIYGTVPQYPNAVMFLVGNQSGGAIGLAAGALSGQVQLVRTTGNSAFESLKTVTIPMANDIKHLYVISKTANSIKLYVDGSEVAAYESESVIVNGANLQLGSVNEGVGSTGFVKFDKTLFGNDENDSTLIKAVIDHFLIYDGVIGPNVMNKLIAAFPFDRGEVFTRTIDTDGTFNWVEEGAWHKLGSTDTFDAPTAKSNVELTVDSFAAIDLNLENDITLGSLSVKGDGVVGFNGKAKNFNGNLSVGGPITIEAPTRIKYGTIDITGGTLDVAEGEGMLTIDLNDYPVADVIEPRTIVISGMVEESYEDDRFVLDIQLVNGLKEGRSVDLKFNESTKCYEVDIAVYREEESMEVIWDDSIPTIEIGARVMTAEGRTTVLMAGDSLCFKDLATPVSLNNTLTGLAIRLENAEVALSGNYPSSVVIDEGGVYDVNGRDNTIYPITLNGGTLANRGNATLENHIQCLPIELTNDSYIETDTYLATITNGYNDVEFKLNGHKLTKRGSGTYMMSNATLKGGGTIEVKEGTLAVTRGFVVNQNEPVQLIVDEGATLTLAQGTGSQVFAKNGALTVENNGTIVMNSGVTPIFDSITGSGTVEFAAMTYSSATQIPLEKYGNESSTIVLNGVSGSTHLGGANLTIPSKVIVNGNVGFNQGSSNVTYTFKTISGSGNLRLETWSGCKGLTYRIDTLEDFTGTLAITNNATSTFNFSIGDIKIAPRFGEPIVKLLLSTANPVTMSVDDITVNGSGVAKILENDGIYLVAATLGEEKFSNVMAAIQAVEAAGTDNFGDIVVIDTTAVLDGDYILKADEEGVIKVVKVVSSKITENTRVSDWPTTSPRVEIDATQLAEEAKPLVVTFDAEVPSEILEVRVNGDVKFVAEEGFVAQLNKFIFVDENSTVTLNCDIDDSLSVNGTIIVENTTLTKAIESATRIEMTGEVDFAGVKAPTVFAHDATIGGEKHTFPGSRTMTIEGEVVIDAEVEVPQGAEFTIAASEGATLRLNRDKLSLGAIKIEQNVTMFIPEGITIYNIKGSGKIDGFGTAVAVNGTNDVRPAATWEGTYHLKNYFRKNSDNSCPQIKFNEYVTAKSKVVSTGNFGWFPQNADVEPIVYLKDEDGMVGLTLADSSSDRWYGFKFAGDGTFEANSKAGSQYCVLIKEYSEFVGKLKAVNGAIYFGNEGNRSTEGKIVVNSGNTAFVAAGKIFNARDGIEINGSIKGSGRLEGNTTFATGATLDCSEGALMLASASTLAFGETLYIKGAATGAVVMKNIPASATLPAKLVLVGNEGADCHLERINGDLVVVGYSYDFAITPIIGANVTVVDQFGNVIPVVDDMISVGAGTMITVTYTPEPGYVGGGSITTTIVNGLTPIRSDLITVKQGAKVIIREYKGAKVKTIEGLDEDGIATKDSIKINGSVYSLTTPSEGVVEIKDDGIVIIHIKPNN